MGFCTCNNNKDTTAAIQCDGCDVWFHRKCLSIPWKEYRGLRDNENSVWLCPECRVKASPNHPSTPKEKIKCHLCPQEFDTEVGLKHHFRHHHGKQYRKNVINPDNSALENQENHENSVNINTINNSLSHLSTTFKSIYSNDNFDNGLFDSCFQQLCETLKTANQVLPGPKHPAAKFYQMRKKKSLFKASSQTFSQSTNPKRSSKKARQKRKDKYNYELLQYEYYNKRKSCVRKIMQKGDQVPCNIPIKTLESSFASRWSLENNCTRGFYGNTLTLLDQNELDNSFSSLVRKDQVDDHLKRMDSQSSPGHDGITVKALKHTECSECLAWLFCNFQKWNIIPNVLKEARTTLIYKKGDKNDPSNWRPISICSVLRRLYERIVLSNMKKYTSVNEFQTGSQNLPGTFVNCSIINGCLQLAKNENRNVTVIFLDIAKAFDSIGHDHLTNTILSLPYPEAQKKIILNVTCGNSTRIRNKQELSKPIIFKRGIFQGSVISPEIFHLCIDYVQNLSEEEVASKFGFPIPSFKPISTAGFVDDTALIGKKQQ